MNGSDLLAQFRKGRAEDAFAEIVRRYTNLVYSVAKRRLCNGAQAEEVTQTVFIKLAKAVPDVRSDAELVAWLHRTTVHASIDLWRAEFRRRAREEHAAAMQPQHTDHTTWNQIAPELDQALNELTDGERQVVLLRFFEQRSMKDVGMVLGISEDAAKMRVSRAVEHLRTMLGQRGAVCSAAAFGALLAERAVEAAPAGLVLALAALKIPAAVGGGLSALTGVTPAKLIAGATLLLATAALVWLVSTGHRNRSSATSAIQEATSENSSSIRSGAAGKVGSTNSSAQKPDPRKLLQAVARARNRIRSGELEFELTTYEDSLPLDRTNRIRLIALFEGNQLRFESFQREYAYLSADSEVNERIAARRRAENMDHEAAIRAGLLRGFESHHVTAYDGVSLLDYWEEDGRPVQARIDEPSNSGSYVFDPRCLGVSVSPGATDTIERCLAFEETASIELAGEELVEGIPSWHVRAIRGSMATEFWLETANPTRVLKYAWNGSVVVCRYDDINRNDPIPIEIQATILHGTTGGQTAYMQRQITRRSGRFNIPVDPTSWTLAGLRMQIGTDVIDYRISRRIGYWTGSGLSDDLPSKTSKQKTPPNQAELMALLENYPGSFEALEAAQWVIFNTHDGPEVDKAAEVILSEHIQDTNLVRLCQELERLRHRSSRKVLEAMLKQNPSRDVRGNACLALATMRKDEAKHGENKQATSEAEGLLERVIADFGNVRRNGTRLADLATPELYELRHVIVGKPAPKTQGQDLEGEPLSLADYRGKVVVLIFWGKCGGCRPEMKPLLKLQHRLEGQPFAILGVYCDDDVSKAKAIAAQMEMNWPSFEDNRLGPISVAWNNNSWPSFNVVDRKGLIRHRNLWQLKVTEVVDALMKE